VGGPIVKNRTFFFALWNGLLPAGRNFENPTVLTPCARNGIFAITITEQRQCVPGADRRRDAENRCRGSGRQSRRAENQSDGTPHNGILLRERLDAFRTRRLDPIVPMPSSPALRGIQIETV
jgi:hypothetical protein